MQRIVLYLFFISSAILWLSCFVFGTDDLVGACCAALLLVLFSAIRRGVGFLLKMHLTPIHSGICDHKSGHEHEKNREMHRFVLPVYYYYCCWRYLLLILVFIVVIFR